MGDEFEWRRPSPPPLNDPPNWSAPPPPAAGPVSPAPPPSPNVSPNGRSGWSRGRTIRTAAIGVVAAGALAFAGVSVASAQRTGSPSTSSPPTTAPSSTAPGTPPAPPKGMGPHGFPGGPLFGGIGAGGAIHGSYVRSNGSGYQTIDFRRGTVTAVSSSSITVQSADKTSQTFSVTSNTSVDAGQSGIGSVKTGDTVSVTAVEGNGPPSAMSIIDTTNLGNIRQHWMPAAPPSAPGSSTSTP